MGKYISNWFSNFEPFDTPFEFQGIIYKTPEHYFQAMKTDNRDERLYIASSETPGIAKRRGRKVVLCPMWEQAKIGVMVRALTAKFAPGTTWAEKLMKTEGDIVEWNNWGDTFWGVDIKTGEGLNHLGKILMKIRKDLAKDDVKARR